MKFLTHSLAAFAVGTLLLAACDENVSQIGSTIAENETTIIVDSLYADLEAGTVFNDDVSTRTTSKLLGRFQSADFGSISCGFASQLMCSSQLGLPDSITVNHIDSLNYIFQAARGSFTGDSLAVQKLTLYKLDKQLPEYMTSSFDPTGYYNPSKPIGSRPYTLSAIAENDTILMKGQSINITVPLPKEDAIRLFNLYKSNPELFNWPQNLAKVYPGILVEPTFGNGCLATLSGFRAFLYYHYTTESTAYEDGEYVTKLNVHKDSIAVFASAPEILSATTIRYSPSEYLKSAIASGKNVLTSPTGYRVAFRFPVEKVLESYVNSNNKLAIVSNLSLTIPAVALKNDYGLGVAPCLLMVKASEAADYFHNNKVPDDRTSFYAEYSEEDACYKFSALRQYLLDMIDKGGNIDTIDKDFILVPVEITTEQYTDPDTYQTVTEVTRCTPYINKPSMTQLDMSNALITFTYTLQSIK